MQALSKIAAGKAEEICRQVHLGEEAQALLSDGMTPADFLTLLTKQEHYADAARFLAHALPKREAVWWACLCARASLTADAKPALLEALKAAEAWVYKPVEENRRAAMARAEAVGFESPSSWAAVAAFWSGGSMAPPDVPPVPPGEALTGVAVAGAVILAAVQTEPERAAERYRLFLEQGIDIANGGNGRKNASA
ncbi:DUF6931 family protein [Rhodospirillaceae bacterium SYSU D60014]|uniref:DUF6931 family protein n=1 Tax=Virgifigura deserti TaxID=2268457 RepID=UPI000E6687DE